MKSDRDLVALYHENTRNYPSQLLFAPGETYSATPSKRYAPHPFDIHPEQTEPIVSWPAVKSSRHFVDREMEKQDLFALLHASYRHPQTDAGILSPTPSAGGLYPLEMYVFIRKVRGVQAGIYSYQRKEGHLTYLREWQLDFLPHVNSFMEQAPVFLLMTANLSQITKKYGARGYRYALLESGHVGQMLALSATKLGLGGCFLGGFFDSVIEDLLQLPPDEITVYGYCVGHSNDLEKES